MVLGSARLVCLFTVTPSSQLAVEEFAASVYTSGGEVSVAYSNPLSQVGLSSRLAPIGACKLQVHADHCDKAAELLLGVSEKA
jgi:hypothetical protein